MRRTFDTCFTLSLIYHLYVLFVWISYQARFGLKISYPAIVFTMVIGLLNCGSFIVHILLLGTSKVFTLSVFQPCACVHVLQPGTRLSPNVTRSFVMISWFTRTYCMRMCTNVVDFRVMRRLCRREWNRQRNWQSVNQHSWDPWQWTTWSRRVTSDFNSVYTVKVRRHKPWSRVRCHGSHECWFTHRQFHS